MLVNYGKVDSLITTFAIKHYDSNHSSKNCLISLLESINQNPIKEPLSQEIHAHISSIQTENPLETENHEVNRYLDKLYFRVV